MELVVGVESRFPRRLKPALKTRIQGFVNQPGEYRRIASAIQRRKSSGRMHEYEPRG
jgi:hypothetical protein